MNGRTLTRQEAPGGFLGREPAGMPANQRSAWGWLFPLLVTAAAGLFLIAVAADGGRAAACWADPVFWLGLLVIFVPLAGRIVSPYPDRRERTALLVVLGVGLFLVRVVEYPLGFTLVDEFQHWRTAQDIQATGHLFAANPLLPISPDFPGLEIATTLLAALSGLPLFAAGMLVLGAARGLLMLALSVLFERLTGSSRLAGLATVLFLANPLFLLFDAQFAYESLAVPLAALALSLCARWWDPMGTARRAWGACAVLMIGAVVVTHHLTAIALFALLGLWLAIGGWSSVRRHEWHKSLPIRIAAGAAVVALAALVTWACATGTLLARYLGLPLLASAQGLVGVLTGASAPRTLFHDGAGMGAPLWERVTAVAAVALIALVVGYALWLHARRLEGALARTLVLAALAYPLGQVFRLAPGGSQVATRPLDLPFVAVAFAVALGLARLRPRGVYAPVAAGLEVALLAVLFVGGVIAGFGPIWERLPGPYLPAADQRSINAESINAASWSARALGVNQRFAADLTNQWLLGTYGHQWIVSPSTTSVLVSSVFFSPQYGAWEQSILARGAVRYLLVDLRMSTGLPAIGYYYEALEPGAYQHTTPIPLAALEKFDGAPNTDRIFDSGDIAIYQTGVLASGD